MFVGGGSVTLYNLTLAYNQTGVLQAGGTVNAYNSLFADNGYTGHHHRPAPGRITTMPPAARHRRRSTTASSAAPRSARLNGGGSFVGSAGLAPGLAYNGGPTETIALLAGSDAIGNGMNPAADGTVLFTDQRGYVPTSASWDIGAYQTTGVPAAAPTATLVAANVSPQHYGQTSYSFTVTYYGAAGLVPGTVAGEVVQVTPPGSVGGPITATVGSIVDTWPADAFGNYQSISVTYTITPPGGSWTSADNGTYDVGLIGSPVIDALGQTGPSGTIGSFLVETGNIGITKFGLIRNRCHPLWSGTIKLTNTGHVGIQRADLRPVQPARRGDPGERHRYLRRDALPGGQRRQPRGRRVRQHHGRVQLQLPTCQLHDLVLPRLPGS